MELSFEEENNGKSFFLDIEVSREGNKFVTVFLKPTLIGVCKHFASSLPASYKFVMIYT